MQPISYAIQAPPGLRFIKLDYQSRIYMVWRLDDHNPAIQKLLGLVGQG